MADELAPKDAANSRKRPRNDKKQKGDPHKTAYENFRYVPIPSCTDKPCTPHSFFAESYAVHRRDANNESNSATMRIHKHVNGLCVVTAGNMLDRRSLKDVEMLLEEAPVSSAGAKRKQQAAMMRGKNLKDQKGVVFPQDLLCRVHVEDGDPIELPCGVWGTLIEINPRLTVGLLQKDPLLTGYLAVVLPTGTFPPRNEDSVLSQQDSEANGLSEAQDKSEEANGC